MATICAKSSHIAFDVGALLNWLGRQENGAIPLANSLDLPQSPFRSRGGPFSTRPCRNLPAKSADLESVLLQWLALHAIWQQVDIAG